MILPECGNTSCAACQYSELTERNECVALERCLYENGYCPFYTDCDTADKSKKAARERAERYGLLAPDGTYRQQRFIHSRREEDKNGIPCIVTRPDICEWLMDLVAKDAIPMWILERYNAAHPERAGGMA